MKFPIDTTALTFIVSAAPRPVTKFGSDEIKLRDGQPLYSLELMAFGEDGADKLNVKIPGKIEITPRTEVKLANLVALPWEQNGKSGISFSADRIEVTKPAKAA